MGKEDFRAAESQRAGGASAAPAGAQATRRSGGATEGDDLDRSQARPDAGGNPDEVAAATFRSASTISGRRSSRSADSPIGISGVFSGANCECLPSIGDSLHGFNSIQEQVHQDLLELNTVTDFEYPPLLSNTCTSLLAIYRRFGIGPYLRYCRDQNLLRKSVLHEFSISAEASALWAGTHFLQLRSEPGERTSFRWQPHRWARVDHLDMSGSATAIRCHQAFIEISLRNPTHIF